MLRTFGLSVASRTQRTNAMESRLLGSTGLRVSRLGLGCWPLGQRGFSERKAERLLRIAVELGITIFDTAPVYGLSEERLGRYLGANANVVIATKCGRLDGAANRPRTAHDFSRRGIRNSLERSRRLLRRDRLDLVLLHDAPALGDEARIAFDTLMDARERGIVGHLGVSDDGPGLLETLRSFPIEVAELTYNFLMQEPAAHIIPLLFERGIGCVVKRPVANLVWSRRRAPAMGTSLRLAWDRARRFPFAEFGDNESLFEFAMRFAFSRKDVTCVLSGTKDWRHLCATAVLVERPLEDNVVAQAQAAFTALTHTEGR